MASVKSHTVDTTERLKALRELLSKEHGSVNWLVVPSEDQRP
jgi:hypothetical protein